MSYFSFDNRKVYYTIKGEGSPVLLLHGDAASSKMFGQVIGMYKKRYKVILIDFPGCGKSERFDKLATDYYYYNSEVCFALLEKLRLDKVTVIGTSGGAHVGVNLALEHPKKISLLIADSFEGEYPMASYISIFESDREQSKRSLGGRMFYLWNHGFGWKKVVDANTRALMALYKSGQSFYHKPVSALVVPAMLTGSKGDEFCDYLEEIYKELQAKNNRLKIYMFLKGNHPAMLSNAEEFINLVERLICT